jgi:hypothetical protein
MDPIPLEPHIEVVIVLQQQQERGQEQGQGQEEGAVAAALQEVEEVPVRLEALERGHLNSQPNLWILLSCADGYSASSHNPSHMEMDNVSKSHLCICITLVAAT